MSLKLAYGPQSSKISKEEVERALTTHPEFPEGSSFLVEEHNGQWVAAIHVAEFPPGGSDDGPPTDSGPATPPVGEDDGPDSDGPPAPGDSSDDKGDKEDKPKGDDKGKDGGEKGELHHLIDMVTKLVDALGLGDPADSPLPGDDLAPPPGGDMGGPPGSPAPGGPDTGPDGKQHIVHDRALKPGEAPPGTTPIGAPAFSNIRDDHPWKSYAGQVATFTVDDEIPNSKEASTQALTELTSLAKEIGYSVKQYQPYEREGKRYAKALVSSY